MSAVDAIINYKRDPEEDFYALLNCDENSTIEQIQTEYKVLALQFHPDKNEGNKDAEAKFQKLKEAKETLCDPEKRLIYDKWRNSGISMSYKHWLGMKEHVGQVRRYTIAEKVDKENHINLFTYDPLGNGCLTGCYLIQYINPVPQV